MGNYLVVFWKCDQASSEYLQELIAYEEIANMNKKIIANKTDSDRWFKAYLDMYDPGLLRAVQKRYLYLLTEKISEINLPFAQDYVTCHENQ